MHASVIESQVLRLLLFQTPSLRLGREGQMDSMALVAASNTEVSRTAVTIEPPETGPAAGPYPQRHLDLSQVESRLLSHDLGQHGVSASANVLGGASHPRGAVRLQFHVASQSNLAAIHEHAAIAPSQNRAILFH